MLWKGDSGYLRFQKVSLAANAKIILPHRDFFWVVVVFPGDSGFHRVFGSFCRCGFSRGVWFPQNIC